MDNNFMDDDNNYEQDWNNIQTDQIYSEEPNFDDIQVQSKSWEETIISADEHNSSF